MSENNVLKRKNEDSDISKEDQLSKRVALDSEQVEESENKEVNAQTAPLIDIGYQGSPEQPITEDVHEETKNEEFRESPEPAIENNDTYDSPVASSDAYSISPDILPESLSKPISNHREKDSNPTYVMLRMYCPVKEASAIVGKKGETINHIREKANVRINISENLKNVPERIVSVKGPSENVAKAFGLMVRTILEEPEDEPASMLSKQYTLKLLVPHPMVGYIIGKSGSKFREIEENSAAKLKASEQPLPYSTDRILSINGVADAIHIAIYYVSQVMIEHKDSLKKNKVVFYNPANYHGSITANTMGIHGATNNSNIMLMGSNTSMGMQNLNALKETHSNPYIQQNKQPYNFQMMFQPSVHPSHQYSNSHSSNIAVPIQQSYTDEHGNTLVGDVITNPPVQIGNAGDKYNEDVYVANATIGSVIGKGGNNIKQIREKSGCTYVKIDPDQNQSIVLGGGRGMTSIRRLTLTGTLQSIQTAIYLINQRIGADKERNSH